MSASVFERPNPFRDIQAFQKQDRFIDVTIKVGSQEFRVHKVILAAGTSYFHRMLKNMPTESIDDVLSIENVSEKSMESFIDFFYTGKIVITKENAVKLMKDAEFLELNDVKDKCAEFLEINNNYK